VPKCPTTGSSLSRRDAFGVTRTIDKCAATLSLTHPIFFPIRQQADKEGLFYIKN